MPRLVCLLASVGLCSVGAFAQTMRSDWVGVCVPSTSDLAYLDSSGARVTLTVTPNFGGTISPGTAESILHRPSDPDVFLIGGYGFVGEARVTAPMTVSYTLITNAIGIATQMSFDAFGNVWVADAWAGQVRRIDAAGAVTPVSIGVQPWGGGLNAGAVDPATGDFIAGGNGALFRLPAGASTAVAWVNGLGGSVTGVGFDPCTGDVLAAVGAPANRLVRVDGNGSVTDLIAPNSAIPDPNGIAVDSRGRFLTGTSQGRVFAVDRSSGRPTLVGTAGGSGAVTGVTVARLPGDGQACTFGYPCSSSYGTPWLRTETIHGVGNPVVSVTASHRPNAVGNVAIAFQPLTPPLNLDPLLGTTGCLQYLDPVTRIAVQADAAGVMRHSLPTNVSFFGASVYLQHVAIDGLQLADITLSNAVEIRL